MGFGNFAGVGLIWNSLPNCFMYLCLVPSFRLMCKVSPRLHFFSLKFECYGFFFFFFKRKLHLKFKIYKHRYDENDS